MMEYKEDPMQYLRDARGIGFLTFGIKVHIVMFIRKGKTCKYILENKVTKPLSGRRN